jgi:uncharacterized protein (TIGR03435 family)
MAPILIALACRGCITRYAPLAIPVHFRQCYDNQQCRLKAYYVRRNIPRSDDVISERREILTDEGRLSRCRSARIHATFAAIAGAALILPFISGWTYGRPPQETPKLTFEVASVHEWGPGQGPTGEYASGVQFSVGRIRSQCTNLQGLIFYAYELSGSERIEGLPEWGNASCGYPDSAGTFAIEATTPARTSIAQSRQMMQALLAERFKLTAHWESRQLRIYALTTISGKSRLKASVPDKDRPIQQGSLSCPADDVHCNVFCCGSTTMTTFAGVITRILGRPVIDKTGLTGSYDLGVLKWADEESAGSSLPSLPTLLRDELGLDLKAERGPVPVLVIDHVEKPSPN